VTAIRSEVVFLAGAVRLPYARFALWNAVGCLAWAVLAATAGRVLGRFVDVEPALGAAERWSAVLGVLVVLAVTAGIAWRVVRARRNPQADPSSRG
jgi:membrane protein DedA with SNARE-associated domain